MASDLSCKKGQFFHLHNSKRLKWPATIRSWDKEHTGTRCSPNVDIGPFEKQKDVFELCLTQTICTNDDDNFLLVYHCSRHTAWMMVTAFVGTTESKISWEWKFVSLLLWVFYSRLTIVCTAEKDIPFLAIRTVTIIFIGTEHSSNWQLELSLEKQGRETFPRGENWLILPLYENTEKNNMKEGSMDCATPAGNSIFPTNFRCKRLATGVYCIATEFKASCPHPRMDSCSQKELRASGMTPFCIKP